MTRGQLLEIVSLMTKQGEGALHVAPLRRGNSLVEIESGEPTVIVADGHSLETTGKGDKREIPKWFGHRVEAVLRHSLDKPVEIVPLLAELKDKLQEEGK